MSLREHLFKKENNLFWLLSLLVGLTVIVHTFNPLEIMVARGPVYSDMTQLQQLLFLVLERNLEQFPSDQQFW